MTNPVSITAEAVVQRMQTDPVAALHVQIAIFSVALENANLRIAELEAAMSAPAEEASND